MRPGPQVGEVYRWAGKRWRVVALEGGRAKIENIDRPANTATMPFEQFQPLRPDHDPVDGVDDEVQS